MKRKNGKKVLIIFLIMSIIAFALALFINQKQKGEEKILQTIKLPIDIWPGNFWIAVAEARGFFEEEGLKAQIIDVSGNYDQSIQDFIDHDILDTNNLSIFDLVNKNIQGANLVGVFVSDESEGAEGLVAKKEYPELEDLEGKRIGVDVGTYLDYFLEVAMLNAGLTPDDYQKVDIVSENIKNEFRNQNLDAAFVWQPDLSEIAEQYDLNIIFDTSDRRGLSPGIFAFKREFIESRPEDVQKLINIWQKATEFILSRPEEVYSLISRIDFADSPNQYYSYEEIKEIAELDPLLTIEDNTRIFSFNSGSESLYGSIQFVSKFIEKSLGIEVQNNTNAMLTDYFIRNAER